ncbi:MAG TPA: hypothetical protein VGN15_09385, partial [Ktedonobacteraceae bacterium]|nr:hypothetical protein [Ktedonobacteraceae bacterium]
GCPGGDGTNSACWGVLASATPIFTQANQLGRSAMTYLPATNRYVLSSWYWPTTNGLNSGTQTELNMSNTSQMVFIDCAHPWSCTGIVSRVDWPTQGYYSEAVIPPSLAADGGYTATGIFNGNFKHAGTFSSASVYTPYMSQFTFKY